MRTCSAEFLRWGRWRQQKSQCPEAGKPSDTQVDGGEMKLSLSPYQRPYRKDRLPRAYFCCRQLAKFRIVRGICLNNMLHWLVCYKPAGQSFPDFGVWVSVDFDSKYKIVWGETREHRIPILEEIKKLKKKNLHNYSNISTPYTIRLAQFGVEGVALTVIPSRLYK